MSNDLEFLSNRYKKGISDALLNAFSRIRSEAKLREVQGILERFGVDGVLNYLNELNIEGIIGQEIIDNLNDAIVDSGRMSFRFLPAEVVVDDTFRFNLLTYNASNYVRNYELSLIQEIGKNTRNAIRQSVHADVLAGNNPITTARNFRSAIGLTQRQEAAVRNFRRMLEEGDSEVLRRLLRDKRFDRTIRGSIETGKPLPRAQIDKMVGRYRERYVKYRTETIARTESLRAVSIGQHQAILQANESGNIDGNRLRRFWVATIDSRTRNPHLGVNNLNPDGVRIDQPFQTFLGPLMYPRDPNGTAANTINCRCGVRYRPVEE